MQITQKKASPLILSTSDEAFNEVSKIIYFASAGVLTLKNVA
jgi:hypothetical protein